jgi:hypothetical protein
MIIVAQRDAQKRGANVGTKRWRTLDERTSELSELPLWTPVQRGGTFHTSRWRHAAVTR